MSKVSDNLYPARLIKKAEAKDIPGIIFILEQNLISHQKVQNIKNLEQTGFLINGFSSDDAKSAIKDEDNFIFLVSTENDDVIGYAIGCNIKILKPIFQEELSSISSEIRDMIASKKILYLRHIAKKINKNNVGKGLLQHLSEYSKHVSYKYIICVIAEKPIQNKASKKFHEKNGFICIGFHHGKDKTSGVYLKKI